jgi:hypothetical protein
MSSRVARHQHDDIHAKRRKIRSDICGESKAGGNKYIHIDIGISGVRNLNSWAKLEDILFTVI